MLSTLNNPTKTSLDALKKKNLDAQFKELRTAIAHHDHENFKNLYFKFDAWMEYDSFSAKRTYGEFALDIAAVDSNEQAFDFIMQLDKTYEYFISQGKFIEEIFTHAIKYSTPSMVNQLIKSNSNLLQARNSFNNEALLATSIREVNIHSIIRNGKFQNENIRKKFMNWFFDINEKSEFLPGEEVVIEYHGPIDMVNMLLSHKADFWSPDKDGITVSEALLNPENLKYKGWFHFTGTGFKNHTFFQAEGESQLSLRSSGLFPNIKSDRSKRLPVVIEYHFTALRQLLERAQRNMQLESTLLNNKFRNLELEIGQNKHLENHISNRLVDLQQQLSMVSAQTDYLIQPKMQKAQWADWLAKPGHENLKLYYDTIVREVEDIFISFKAGSGHKVVLKDGKVGAVNKVLNMIGEAVSVPTLGLGNTILKLTVGKSLKKVDDIRQYNGAQQSSKLGGNLDDIKKESRALAKKLTISFAQPLLNLATEEEARQYLDSLRKGLNKVKEVVLNSQFIPPAEQEALMALAWIDDLISDAPQIAERAKREGLANVLFSEIINRTPSSDLKQKWQSVTKTINGVITKTGETYHPADLYEFTGFRTENHEYFVEIKSKPELFGWKLVSSYKDIENLRLRMIEAPSNLPPEELLTLRLSHTFQNLTLPVNPAFRNDNNLHWTPQNGNMVMNMPNITFGYSVYQNQFPTPTLPPLGLQAPIIEQGLPNIYKPYHY